MFLTLAGVIKISAAAEKNYDDKYQPNAPVVISPKKTASVRHNRTSFHPLTIYYGNSPILVTHAHKL
jgi:hypothetical protein